MRVLLAVFDNYSNARGAIDEVMARRGALAQSPDASSALSQTGVDPGTIGLRDAANHPVRVAVEVRTEHEATQIRHALEHFHPLSVVEGFAAQRGRFQDLRPQH